jgi:predicted metal-dependent HD superfamily phosphohydrolase
MNYQEIIRKAEDFVRSHYKEHRNLNLLYHTIAHTEKVVTAVTEITNSYRLSEKEFFICIIAAWFHDIGYYEDALNHEEVGAKKAEEFLMSNGVDEETTRAVKNCVLATKIPQNPTDLLEQIVCDADLYHFGTDEFQVQNKLMRKETELMNNVKIDKDEWQSSTLLLMENHHFHTDYCNKELNQKKKENLRKLEKKVRNKQLNINPMFALLHQYQLHHNHTVEKEKINSFEQPERGTETLFRIASGIGQRLNEQADTKAHILISVNAIIVSVFLAIVVRRLEVYAYLTLPSIMFLTVNVITIIFSILATRPSVPDGVFDLKEVENKDVNLLFFGNFYKMNFNDYSKSMLQVISDKNYLYLTLIKNLYDQGVVLGKKYRLLKVAYNVFMFGLVVSVAAFFLASRWSHPL